MCCYHSFPRPWLTVFGFTLATCIWDWYASDDNFVELRVIAGRSLTLAVSPHAVSRRPCCAVALRRTAWSEHGMGAAWQVWIRHGRTVNKMGKTHSKPLAAGHGRGTAWARHAMCESALKVPPVLRNPSQNSHKSRTALVKLTATFAFGICKRKKNTEICQSVYEFSSKICYKTVIYRAVMTKRLRLGRT